MPLLRSWGLWAAGFYKHAALTGAEPPLLNTRFSTLSAMNSSPRIFITVAAVIAACGSLRAAVGSVDYNQDVRPILSENCFACHGFDEKARKAKLRLDVAEAAYAEHDGITPLKPGDLAGSEAWTRIVSEDADEKMPPPKSHKKLTATEKETLRRWIEQGAKYAGHWSFIPPKKAPVPEVGCANPIDAFVRQRLAKQGWKPAPEADRATLIRRVTLDLTGLPPRAQEVEAFVHDPDPRACEKLVDRLLASEHFGERMALDWLDAARYADTNGFSIDGGRHMWLWRDYVIHAFNSGKPYDQFLVEQIAGDQLPERTGEQLIASGFQRNNMVTHEGGTIPEENLTNYNVDRVKTLGEAVLGLTLGCAQCHDHKFDPITQHDYFSLFAYFNTTSDVGLDGNGGINPRPHAQARTVLRTGEEAQLKADLARLGEEMAHPPTAAGQAWEAEQLEELRHRGEELELHAPELLKVSTPNRADFEIEEGRFMHVAAVVEMSAFDVSIRVPALDRPITGLRLIVHPDKGAPGGGWGYGPQRRAERKAGKGELPEKGSFVLTSISVSADAVPSDQINLYRLQGIAGVTANCWDEKFRPEGSLDPRNENGWAPPLAHEGAVHLTVTFSEPLPANKEVFFAVQLNFGHGQSLVAKRMEIAVLTGRDDGSLLTPEVIAIVQKPRTARTAGEQKQLTDYFAAHAPAMARTRVEIANLEERLAVLTQEFPTMVMDVAAKPRETFILNRGNYAAPTVKVEMATPAFLPALPAGPPADRLGLAQWVVMPGNPLTARVAVNRLWQMLFGTGIVKTAADFGAQGEWPSHPDLLDWLAVNFIESGWNVKALVRLMATSETYRQSSVATPEQLDNDPANRLLARGPRFRLPAEFIRDAALQVSGLLVSRLGGPSVNPYTPGDPWREISHYGSTPATAQTFVQDHGEKLYRRSLYTYWKRTVPPPNMAAFDAPNREVCVVSRPSTNTPLQALVLLNDTQYVEASRAFAERILAQPGDDAAKMRWAFEEALSRLPGDAESAVLQGALARERARYSAHPQAATEYLGIGESLRNEKLPAAEHAAWSQVAALLLNLSETITRN